MRRKKQASKNEITYAKTADAPAVFPLRISDIEEKVLKLSEW